MLPTTDDRQTDRQTTDGRATAYSEREHEFTFAKNECGILNLDDSSGNGTHWVLWYRKNNTNFYFNSYGVQPPQELQQYLKSAIFYITEKIQPKGEVFCGHLCLHVLKKLSLGRKLQDIVNDLH